MSISFGRFAVRILCGLSLLVATQGPLAQGANAEGVKDSSYQIRMNGIDLSLDRQTGSIEYLSSPLTGMLLEGTREQSGLLDVAYPTSEFAPLRLATRFSKAEIEREGEGVVLPPDCSNWNLNPSSSTPSHSMRSSPAVRSIRTIVTQIPIHKL